MAKNENKEVAIPQKKCFVIAPFGEAGSEVRRNFEGLIEVAIKHVAEPLGFEVSSSLDDSISGSITNGIIRDLLGADMVVADLSTINANVMYELAVRHAFAKPVIQIVETGTTLPFDLKDQRTIHFTRDPKGLCDLRTPLTRAFEENIQNKDIDNPVTLSIKASQTESTIEPDSPDEFLLSLIRKLENEVSELKKDNEIFRQPIPRYQDRIAHRFPSEQPFLPTYTTDVAFKDNESRDLFASNIRSYLPFSISTTKKDAQHKDDHPSVRIRAMSSAENSEIHKVLEREHPKFQIVAWSHSRD